MKISLCLCTYNGEKYLKEQLDTIVNQTLVPDEIIAVDDCSSDNTITILNEYKDKYPNINWNISVNENNVGWRTNFKNAINKATGDIIFLSDQDDIWKLDKIERMVDVISKREEIQVLTCNFIWKNENDNTLSSSFKETNNVTKITGCKNLCFTNKPGCAFCFKKEILDQFNLIWDKNFAHDSLLFKIGILNNSLYDYDFNGIIFRRHSSNSSTNYSKKLSKENAIKHQNDSVLYNLYFEQLSKLPILDSNKDMFDKCFNFVKLRKKLYEEKNISTAIKLVKYIKIYSTPKSLIYDLAVPFMKIK